MSWENNIYGHPENYGLQIFKVLEENLSYEFNMLVVWKNEKGEFFWAQDSGCSCPSPFENYNSVSDLYKIDPNNLEPFQQAVEIFPGGSQIEKLALIIAVRVGTNFLRFNS